MDSTSFLNFYNILVNELVGDPVLFIVLALGIVSFVLVKSRAPSQVFLLVLFAVTGMLAVEFPILLWFLPLFIGLIAGWLIYGRLRRE